MRQFNKQRPLPDVQKEEWAACASTEGLPQGDVGYQPHGDHVNDFIEKQVSSESKSSKKKDY